MQKPIKINIDTLTNDTVCNYNNIRKGDTLKFTINMYQNSASLSLSGQSIHVILQKNDGYSVEKIFNIASGNVITAIFDEQATLATGEVQGEVQLIDSDGTCIANRFTFEVETTLADDIVIKSSDSIETLRQIQNLIDNYNSNADNLATQNSLALVNISTIGTSIATANNSKAALDTSKTNADTTKVAINTENLRAESNIVSLQNFGSINIDGGSFFEIYVDWSIDGSTF